MPAHVEEWAGEDVAVADVERALCRLREEAAHETEGPDMRTSVMTHLAWVPHEWREAAMETLAGLGDRHPSRGIMLSPEPEAADGIDAKVSMLAFPLRAQRKHVAAEVIELTLRGRLAGAPASVVTPLLVIDLPVFLRWRGRPPFGATEVEQLVDVADRLVVDSREWPDVPAAYRELPFRRAACSDIAWRRVEPWRRALSELWPGIAEMRKLTVRGPLADASLLAGWLRVRLGREIQLDHEDAERIEKVSADGEEVPAPRDEPPTPSDLLSAELDQFGRDPVYEEAAASA
ncbi:MAG TPA: glucose-6-phosphate dehydrogenase assembly protein OpcA [Gaiellaceae bacterium]|nr:glucose-6-phosphate dehydrogenase assembly protein OpcA [Gaiellaceae bacterium]